eukprot:SAG22_NODE_1580_length_4066_cov_3.253844_2_plen_577_part_00
MVSRELGPAPLEDLVVSRELGPAPPVANEDAPAPSPPVPSPLPSLPPPPVPVPPPPPPPPPLPAEGKQQLQVEQKEEDKAEAATTIDAVAEPAMPAPVAAAAAAAAAEVTAADSDTKPSAVPPPLPAGSQMTVAGHRNDTHHVMDDGVHMPHGDHDIETHGPIPAVAEVAAADSDTTKIPSEAASSAETPATVAATSGEAANTVADPWSRIEDSQAAKAAATSTPAEGKQQQQQLQVEQKEEDKAEAATTKQKEEDKAEAATTIDAVAEPAMPAPVAVAAAAAAAAAEVTAADSDTKPSAVPPPLPAGSQMTVAGHRNDTHHVMDDGVHMPHGDHDIETHGPIPAVAEVAAADSDTTKIPSEAASSAETPATVAATSGEAANTVADPWSRIEDSQAAKAAATSTPAEGEQQQQLQVEQKEEDKAEAATTIDAVAEPAMPAALASDVPASDVRASAIGTEVSPADTLPPPPPPPDPEHPTVVFTERGQLGLGFRDLNGQAVISEISAAGQAAQLSSDLRVGMALESVEDNSVKQEVAGMGYSVVVASWRSAAGRSRCPSARLRRQLPSQPGSSRRCW